MSSRSSLSNLISNNSEILKNVFLTLICQLFITFITVYALRKYPEISEKLYSSVLYMIFFFLGLIALIILILNYDIPIIYRFIFFCIFSILFGLSLSRLNKVNNEVLMSSLLSTLGVFIVMFIFGVFSVYYNFNLSGLGSILFFALTMLIVANVIFLICGVSETTHKIYIYIGIVVFSLYIMFDTFIILKDKRKDFISGALSYYLDVINLFIRFGSAQNN